VSSSNAQRFLATGADDTALALKMFTGTVLEAFRAKSKLWHDDAGVISKMVINNGKSHQFILNGDVPVGEYHTPGDELLGQAYEFDEGTITVDQILVVHYDIPLDQTRMSHFPVIAPKMRDLGVGLAIDLDRKLFRVGVNSARSAAVTKNGITIHNGGNRVERVAATLAAAYAVSVAGAQNFRDDVAALGQAMNEDNVPEDGRNLFIGPYIRRVLGKDPTIFDKDYSNDSGDMNARRLPMLEGFILHETNHLPSTSVTAGPTSQRGDFTVAGASGQPAALALCGARQGNGGVGFVQNGDIYTHMHFDERRNTTFMKAQIIGGMGILAPYCAGVIEVDDS